MGHCLRMRNQFESRGNYTDKVTEKTAPDKHGKQITCNDTQGNVMRLVTGRYSLELQVTGLHLCK